MKLLFIAERFNQERKPSWERYVYDEQSSCHGRWCEISLRVGAFLLGDGRTRIESLGFEHLDVSESRSMNLLPPAPQSVVWDTKKAKEVAAFVTWQWSRRQEWDGLVLVGRRVATAFGYQKVRLGSYEPSGVFVLPHPSGLSRWWNDPVNVENTRENVREYLFLRRLAKEDKERKTNDASE